MCIKIYVQELMPDIKVAEMETSLFEEELSAADLMVDGTQLINQKSNHTKSPFGRSLHIDLYGINKEICDDLSFCYQLLEDLTDFLNMHKQSPPYIFRSPDKQFPDKAGLSGWVPLIESGISIHTLTVKEFVSIDIYTCGDLDIEKTINYLCNLLKSKSYEHQYLIRGTNYYS